MRTLCSDVITRHQSLRNMNFDYPSAMVTANTNEDKPSLTRLFGLIMLAELGVSSNARSREPYRLGATEKCEAEVHIAVDA